MSGCWIQRGNSEGSHKILYVKLSVESALPSSFKIDCATAKLLRLLFLANVYSVLQEVLQKFRRFSCKHLQKSFFFRKAESPYTSHIYMFPPIFYIIFCFSLYCVSNIFHFSFCLQFPCISKWRQNRLSRPLGCWTWLSGRNGVVYRGLKLTASAQTSAVNSQVEHAVLPSRNYN